MQEVKIHMGIWKSRREDVERMDFSLQSIGKDYTELIRHSLLVSQEENPTMEMLQFGLGRTAILERKWGAHQMYTQALRGRYFYELMDLHERLHPQQPVVGGGRGQAPQVMTWEEFVQQYGFTSRWTACRYRRLYILMVRFPGLLLCGENITQFTAWISSIYAFFKRHNSIASFFRAPIEGMEIPPPRDHWTKVNTKGMHMRWMRALGRHQEKFEGEKRQRLEDEEAEQAAADADPAAQAAVANTIQLADAQDVYQAPDRDYDGGSSETASDRGGPSGRTLKQRYRFRGRKNDSDSEGVVGAVGAMEIAAAAAPQGTAFEGASGLRALPAYPAAVKLAEANNIDVSRVLGTGANGKIKVSDVQRIIQQGDYDQGM